MKNVALCTVSSNNYYSIGKTLLESVRAVHDDIDLYYLLVDRPHPDIENDRRCFELVYPDQLEIPAFCEMAFVYSITELNTVVKPYFFQTLFKKGYRKILFLDPDICVYHRLDEAIALLDSYNLVVTPHAIAPAPHPTSYLDKVQWEQNMLYTGIFNLGFVAMAATEETMNFLKWWEHRCRYLCFVDPSVGLFVDQKWAELAIALFDNVYVLKHRGYNMSVWNLHERSLVDKTVNQKEPLVFYHFSSLDYKDESIISKHDRNIKISSYPEIKKLFDDYRQRLNKNKYSKYSAIQYAYGQFKDGKPIDLLERRLYAMVADAYNGNPFNDTRKEFYRKLRRCTPSRKSKKTYYFLGTILYLFLKLFGPATYRKVFEFLEKSTSLRFHTFLIR